MNFSRHGRAGPGTAGRGLARQYVTQYGNWDNFSGRGEAWLGGTWPGKARRGRAGQNVCRWAVSPDTFGKQKQGNQSKTT